MRFPKFKRSGLTLVELCVVLAIIATLMSLLLPAIQRVRAASARAACKCNLRQLGIAFHCYHASWQRFPTDDDFDLPPFGYGTFYTALLPHIEEQNLSLEFTASSVTSADGQSLTDTTRNWTPNAHQDRRVKITSGTGKDQIRIVTENSANKLTLNGAWTVQPDNTSMYVIDLDYAIPGIDTAPRQVKLYLCPARRKVQDVKTANLNDYAAGHHSLGYQTVGTGPSFEYVSSSTPIEIRTRGDLWYDHRVVDGMSIRISGLPTQYFPGINKEWSIRVTGSSSFTLNGSIGTGYTINNSGRSDFIVEHLNQSILGGRYRDIASNPMAPVPNPWVGLAELTREGDGAANTLLLAHKGVSPRFYRGGSPAISVTKNGVATSMISDGDWAPTQSAWEHKRYPHFIFQDRNTISPTPSFEWMPIAPASTFHPIHPSGTPVGMEYYLGSPHRDSMPCLFADGHVHDVAYSIAPSVLVKLWTWNDGGKEGYSSSGVID